MKKKEYGKGLKILTVLLESIFALIFALSVSAMALGTSIHVNEGGRFYNYSISPFQEMKEFENSEVLTQIMGDKLENIVRYGVISGQMETDGRFDEEKEIDIEQYARHFEEVPVSNTSVSYRLGDLIQWGQYGLSMTNYPVSEVRSMIEKARLEAAAESLIEEMEITESAAEGNGEETVETAHTYAAEVIPEYAEERNTETYLLTEDIASAASVYVTESDTADEEEYVRIPVERYLPADGKSLLSHVETVEELELLGDYLEETVSMLQQNFDEYKFCKEYYGNEELNFKYCMLVNDGSKNQMYANLDLEEKSKEEITEYFSSLGRYLYFAPADFHYETDMDMEEGTVRSIWNTYRYAHPEDSRIWIGLDTAYPYDDIFSQVKKDYNTAVPGDIYLILATVSAVFMLGMLGLMTCLAGHKKDWEGIYLIRFDRLNTEMSMFLAFLLVGGSLLMSIGGLSIFFYQRDYGTWMQEGLILAGLGTLVTNGIFVFFYLSLVRRIKAKTFWSNFLAYRVVKKCIDLAVTVYDNSPSIAWIWIPYISFVLINGCLFATGGGVVAVVLDVPVGIILYRNYKKLEKIVAGIEVIQKGNLDYQIPVKDMHGSNKKLAEAVNNIGNGIREAVETSMKDERMKADLITNVSHDIKTPLTSIINYVDLIKREPIEDEKIKGYIEVLESKSQRLKILTEDLVEASKISSGNITLQMEKINFVELLNQTVGEFTEKFQQRGLMLIVEMPGEPVCIHADSRRIWRVVENLFNNIYKYALENTRVYLEVRTLEFSEEKKVRLSLKNISEQPLNVDAQDLTERFIRGDVSRSTEGSGLGLSIAKNLTELQKGSFEIVSDGDLFKVLITFPRIEETGI